MGYVSQNGFRGAPAPVWARRPQKILRLFMVRRDYAKLSSSIATTTFGHAAPTAWKTLRRHVLLLSMTMNVS